MAVRSDADEISVTDKQLGRNIARGCMVTFQVFDGNDVTGYVAGWDSESYLVLEPQGDTFRKLIVRKITNPTIELHTEATFANEPCYAGMEEIVSSFRAYVYNRVLGRQNTQTRKVG